jgi:AraC family L-rhamnose operon regulatory protein RhaS
LHGIVVQNISVKSNAQLIQPYRADGVVYHADTCRPLVDAVERKKLRFNALARYTYPGHRLTEDTLGLNSVGYWDADEPQDWGLDWHRNEGIEIHFLESGTMPYSQGGRDMMLKPNDLTITRPWEAHKVGNPTIGMGKFYWVILDLDVRRPHQKWNWPDWIMLAPSDLRRLTTILRQNDRTLWQADERIRECFFKIGKAVDSDRKGSNASMIRLLINNLFLLLLDMLDTEEVLLNESLTDSSRSVQQFLKELDKKLEENWTIEDMAKSAGVGLTRFTYHCKRLTNLTPMRYLMMKRLEKARHMLKRYPDISVAEVAYACGFATSQYFSTVFKRNEKCTPVAFRKGGNTVRGRRKRQHV